MAKVNRSGEKGQPWLAPREILKSFENNTVGENFSGRLYVDKLYPFEESFPTAKMGQNLQDEATELYQKPFFGIQWQNGGIWRVPSFM